MTVAWSIDGCRVVVVPVHYARECRAFDVLECSRGQQRSSRRDVDYLLRRGDCQKNFRISLDDRTLSSEMTTYFYYYLLSL